MRRLTSAVVAVVVLAPAGAAIAKSKHHHQSRNQHQNRIAPRRSASFDGTCKFSGVVKFSPAMTNSLQPVAQDADAPGICTGTFADGFGRSHTLDNAAATYSAQSSGSQVSCALGLAAGSGSLTFTYGEIAFTMHEYRVAAVPIIRLDGKDGGSAWMPATPSPDSDPVAAVQACNGGGLSEFKLDAHLRTAGAVRG